MGKWLLLTLSLNIFCFTSPFTWGSETEPPPNPDSYQVIIVRGLPFQRGESHGRQAKDKILSMISFYKDSPSMPPWSDCVDFVQRNYIHALELYFPNGLEEMRGIASGAGVTLEDIIILNARYDLSRWQRSQILHIPRRKKERSSADLPECANVRSNSSQGGSEGESLDSALEANECTGAVALSSATLNGQVLLGQNWDQSAFILENNTAFLLEVHPDPCEGIKPFVMLTEAGQLGRFGMNADGLGVISMGLWSTGDIFENSGQGWVPISLLRRMFLEAPNFSIGLRRILQTPRHVSVNIMIATAEDEALNIELTPNEYFVTHVPLDKEFFTHSNHFKSAGFIGRSDIKEGSRGSSSLFRDRRVAKHLFKAWPMITERTFEKAFNDMVGSPNAVCEILPVKGLERTSASPREATIASLVFNLSKRTLQLSKGPPCQDGVYKTFRFGF